MTASESISEQATRVHTKYPDIKIGVYRNGIKAVNIFSGQREKLDDPACAHLSVAPDCTASSPPLAHAQRLSPMVRASRSCRRKLVRTVPRLPTRRLATQPLVQGPDTQRPMRQRRVHHPALHLRALLWAVA